MGPGAVRRGATAAAAAVGPGAVRQGARGGRAARTALGRPLWGQEGGGKYIGLYMP